MTATDEARALDPANPPDAADFDAWTLDEVQAGMRIVAHEMRDLRDRVLTEVTAAEANARRAAQVAHAQARMRAKAEHGTDSPRPTVQDLDDIATTESIDEAFALDVAIGARRAAFARLRSLEAELSALQTVHRFLDSMERGR